MNPANPRPHRAILWTYRIGVLCVLSVAFVGCCAPPTSKPAAATKTRTYSSFDVGSGRGEADLQPGNLNFINTDLVQVLNIYQELSGRTVIRPATLPAPTISIRNQTPVTRVGALQLLDTVLAQNGIAMVLVGDESVKAVPEARAGMESPPEINLPWKDLPDSGSFMMRRVHLKKLKPSEIVPVLQPMARAPNAIMPLDISRELILRDYSSNVKRMLQVLEDIEKNSVR